MAALTSQPHAETATLPRMADAGVARSAAFRPSADHLVSRGQELARAGYRAAAHAHFVAALSLAPRHEDAWLWRAGTAAEPGESLHCLEQVLWLNPANAAARLGLEQVRRQLAPSEPAGEASPGRDRRRGRLAARRTLLLSLLLAACVSFASAPGHAGSGEGREAGGAGEPVAERSRPRQMILDTGL